MTDDLTTRYDGVLERTADGGVIRFERHLACDVVGLQASLARLEPSLAGRPEPWDWGAFAAGQAHYADRGLAAPVAAS